MTMIFKTDPQRINTMGILMGQMVDQCDTKENIEMFCMVFDMNKPEESTRFVSKGTLIGMSYTINMLMGEMKLPDAMQATVREAIRDGMELFALNAQRAQFAARGEEAPADMIEYMDKIVAKYPVPEDPVAPSPDAAAAEVPVVEQANGKEEA